MVRLDKSNKNILAASEMIQSNLFAPSVHASYYGTFLLMKHIANHRLSMLYQDQDDPEKGNISHDRLVQTVCNSDPNLRRLMRSKIATINLMRRRADYSDALISKENAEEIHLFSKEVRTELSNFYNITL